MSARIRTGYSFRKAAGSLEDVVGRIKDCGWASAPITDTTTFGWGRWRTLCTREGLRPVYGIEIPVKLGDGPKGRPILDPWVFLAKTSVVPLNRLVALATEQFYYEPQLTIPQALSVPDLFVIYGNRTDPLLLGETSVSPSERSANILAGLSPASAAGWIRRAQAASHALIAIGANRYPRLGQKPLYEALAGKSPDVQTYPQHILSDPEWRRTVPAELADMALGMRDAVLAQCVADLPQGQLPTIRREKTLRQMCAEGAHRLSIDLRLEEYYERLDHELATIAAKGFEDYFYIVADICQFARSRMLVGPARGSSCGSLVCFLLGITTVDPIPFGLLFERFIDTSRDDLPDIDIDFSDEHRDLVFEYVRERFGADHVARLGTVNFFQARSAFKEACSALDLPPWTTEPVVALAEKVGVKQALESDAGAKIMQSSPEVALAVQLDGHPRHAGQHAAGVVITRGPVTDVVAVDRKTGATQCDLEDAKDLNLLKIDALGLTQLGIFEHALQLAKLPRDHLFKVPLDDPQAFAVLNQKHFAGVFQFNGQAVESICKTITIESIHDMIAINALARPGAERGAAEWVARRTGKHKMEQTALDNLLPETFGCITYQEQVMRICREVAEMDWATVNNLRRVISKTKGLEEGAKFKQAFVAGAVKNVDHEQAEKLWDKIVAFSEYGFNKSHSTAYAIVAYWCCWLKAYHAVEYAAAMLTSAKSEDQQLAMLREMEHENVPFVAADPKLSTDKWTVNVVDGKRTLLGPLTNIVGIGPEGCKTIMSARALGHELSGSVAKALAKLQFKIPNTTPVASRLAEIMPDPRARNIISTPMPIKDVTIGGNTVMVIGVVDRMKPQKNDAIGVWVNDDDTTIWCWVPKYLATQMLDRGRFGNSIYAIKGTTPQDNSRGDRAVIFVGDIKYIGDMEKDEASTSALPAHS